MRRDRSAGFAVTLAAVTALTAAPFVARGAPAPAAKSAAQPAAAQAPAQPVDAGPADAPRPTVRRQADANDVTELEQLREELQALKNENAELRRKIDELTGVAPKAANKPAAAAAANKPVRRNFSRIEIGMTRQEVDLYVKTHKNLKLVGISADSGVRTQSEETVVHREGTTGTTTLRRGGPANSNPGPGTMDDRQEALNSDHKEVIERKINSGRRETMTLAQMVPEKVAAGEKRNSLGSRSTVYATQMREAGRLRITLVDDVVTAIDGTQYN